MVARWTGLHPTSPTHSSRYDQTKLVETQWQSIPTGLYSSVADPEPPYLNPGWSSYIHPEGAVYYARDSVPRIVTSSNIQDSEILSQVEAWMKVLEKSADDSNIKFTPSMEVFLELMDSVDGDFDWCEYYIADHTTCTIFWLEEINSYKIGTIRTAPGDHIRLALEAQYWLHVEYFPSHGVAGQNLSINELIDIYAQAQTDQLTSSTSTFPRNAKECKEFVKILKTYRESLYVTPYARWTIARLWNIIAHYRTLNHHGQEVCRLAIDQGILDIPTNSGTYIYQGKAFRIVSRLMFDFPTSYHTRLETVYTDQMVNTTHWSRLIESCQAEWKACLVVGLALLSTNLLISMSPLMSNSMCSAVCIFLSNAIILSAIFLLVRLQNATKYSASQALSFLEPAGCGKSDFRITSIQFALPKALLLWTLAASTLQTLVPFLGERGVCALVVALAVLVCGWKFRAVCAEQVPRIWKKISWTRKVESDPADELV